MKRLAMLFFTVAVLSPFGCSRDAVVPEIFKMQLMKFLEEGARTNAKISQGVSYMELREHVVNTNAAYDMISSTWPATLAGDFQVDFDRAITGWGLALELWELKLSAGAHVNAFSMPTEPNFDGFIRYVDYAGDHLVVKVHDEDLNTRSRDAAELYDEHFRGKKYLPFDENISILLTIAGSSFNKGKDAILRELQ